AFPQRRQPGHFLQRGVAPRALVHADAVHRCDLAGEVAAVDRAHRPLVAGQRELFELRPLDAPLLADELRAAELRDLLVAVALFPAGPNPQGPALSRPPACAPPPGARASSFPPPPRPPGPACPTAPPAPRSAAPAATSRTAGPR